MSTISIVYDTIEWKLYVEILYLTYTWSLWQSEFAENKIESKAKYFKNTCLKQKGFLSSWPNKGNSQETCHRHVIYLPIPNVPLLIGRETFLTGKC